MIVMPANNSNAHTLEMVFPGQLGLIMCPSGIRNPRDLTWALDSELYAAWRNSKFSELKSEIYKHWDKSAFLKMIEWAKKQVSKPRWITVPDVPGNAYETLKQWDKWYPIMKKTGFQLAMVVQDGMKPSDVPEGVVCFMGGTTDWKWQNVERFCAECWRTHVGRVNQYRYFWRCHEAGAESCDGSGVFRGDQKQLRGFIAYLKESAGYTERIRQGELL